MDVIRLPNSFFRPCVVEPSVLTSLRQIGEGVPTGTREQLFHFFSFPFHSDHAAPLPRSARLARFWRPFRAKARDRETKAVAAAAAPVIGLKAQNGGGRNGVEWP